MNLDFEDILVAVSTIAALIAWAGIAYYVYKEGLSERR